MFTDVLDEETVSLLPGNFTMTQPKDMTLFTITTSVLEETRFPRNGIRMKVTMKRKIMSEMMTTYFPSLLLMMITYATTFFKPFFFEAALSVNLTTMLVMTTIFISKMEGLPPTSDIKMIDIWLILCQLVPFSQVVILTAMEFLREEEQEEKEEEKTGEDQQIMTKKENQKGIAVIDSKTKDNLESNQQEAWMPVQAEKSRTGYVKTLLTVGKFLL